MGLCLAGEIGCLSFKAEGRVQPPLSPFEICGGESGTGTGFSPSTCFPCQYHSTNSSHSSSPSSICWSEQKDNLAKPGNLPKSTALSDIREG